MTPKAVLSVPLARHRRAPKGLASIEMVLVTPVLLLLLLGVAEITNAFVEYNTLVKSTQTAARYLANHSTPGNTNLINLTEEVITNAERLLIYGTTVDGGAPLLEGLGESTIAVTTVDAAHVGVTVNYGYRPLFGGIIPGFFGQTIDTQFTLTASSVMRAL
jgi:Flp pilus assembly protein TadG